MSDLSLYKRTRRLNQALRERKQHAEVQQALESLKRTLGIEEDVMMSTIDLLREVCNKPTASLSGGDFSFVDVLLFCLRLD